MRLGRGMRWAVIILASAALLGAAAVAHAYLTAGGAGSGAATAGAGDPVTLSPAATSADLYPGGSADVAVSITNPNPFAAAVGSLVVDETRGHGGFAVDAGHAGCDLSALSFAAQPGGGWLVGAGATIRVDLADAVSLAPDAAPACQGATFTVYLQAAA
jgi:hypothetical protein